MAESANAILESIQSQNVFLQQQTSGMLTKLLQTGVVVEKQETNDEGVEITKTETVELTLREVMLDQDFIAEAKMSNELLARYMTRDRVIQIVDYLVDEPGFNDDAERCF